MNGARHLDRGDEATPGERGRKPDAGRSPVQHPAAEMVPVKAKVGSFAVRGQRIEIEIIRVDRQIKIVVDGKVFAFDDEGGIGFDPGFDEYDVHEEHALTREQVAALRSLLSDE